MIYMANYQLKQFALDKMSYYNTQSQKCVTECLRKKLLRLGIFSVNLDEVIDELRIRYRIVIYNSVAPYVDPMTNDGTILYRFTTKLCSMQGYNFREILGKSIQTPNIYVAKRQAIAWAINYLLKTRRK